MNCKKCGNVLKAEDKVCSNCGEPVDQSNNADSSIIKQENLQKEKNINNKKSNNALIIILTLLVLLVAGFVIYASIIKYTSNDDEPDTPNVLDNSLDNNIDDNDDQNKVVNYVLNNEIANAYNPITDTKVKINDSVLTSAIIMEIDENKNVGYYFEDCNQNCEPAMININDEHAKYITFVSQGYAARFIYIILTEEGNIYKGNIDNNVIEDAKKIETNNKFINITYGGSRVEQSGKAGSVLGVTGNNDYYNIIYCPDTKSGNYLTYSYYSDISDPNNTKNEYVLIYNDGFLSYLSISTHFDAQRCNNYDYNQYIVNSSNEKIQAQVILYNDGFYILGTDGYLYKLTSIKNGDNYVADLYSTKKVKGYSYNQEYAYIRSIIFEYDDKSKETIDNTYGNVQIVMIEEK